MDLHSVVDSARGVLAAGAAGVGALSDSVVVAVTVPAHRDHGGCSLQVPALGFDAAREGASRTGRRLTAAGKELRVKSKGGRVGLTLNS